MSDTRQATAATSILRRMIGFRPMMSIKKAFTEARKDLRSSFVKIVSLVITKVGRDLHKSDQGDRN